MAILEFKRKTHCAALFLLLSLSVLAEAGSKETTGELPKKKVWLGCAAPAIAGGIFKKDYLATMTNPKSWKSVLPHVKGVTMKQNDFHIAKVKGKMVQKMSNSEIKDYVSFVEKNDLLFGVEIGGLRLRKKRGKSKEMMTPTEYMDILTLPLLKRWTDAGGKLDLVSTDHAIAYTVKEIPEKSWEKATEMFAEAMAAFHKAYPNTKIGIFESLGYFDVTLDDGTVLKSASKTTPAIDFQKVLELTKKAFKKRKVPLDFFILDYQIKGFIGDHARLNKTGKSKDANPLTAPLSFDRVHAVHKLVKNENLDFYFLFTPGQYGHDDALNGLNKTQANERAAKIMQRVFESYVKDGGRGDELFIYTWHAYPSYVGPESRENSFMNIAKKVTASDEYEQFWGNSSNSQDSDSSKPPMKKVPAKKIPASKAGEKSSENSKFLASFLKKNPTADADKDGIMTSTEFKKYKLSKAKGDQ